jgi:hypothetical protein
VPTGRGVGGGSDGAHGREGVHAAVGDAGLAVPDDAAVAVDGVAADGVALQYEGVAVGAVFVVVVPAERFPAAVQVVVVGLVELAGVGHGRVVAQMAHAPVAHVVVLEDGLGLLQDGLAVEEVVVVPVTQEGQPRPQDHVVVREAGVVLDEAKVEDVAVEVAQAAVFAREGDGDHLAQDVLELDVGAVGQDFDGVLEVAREAFAGIEPVGGHESAGRGVVVGEGQAQHAAALALGVQQRAQRRRRVEQDAHGDPPGVLGGVSARIASLCSP